MRLDDQVRPADANHVRQQVEQFTTALLPLEIDPRRDPPGLAIQWAASATLISVQGRPCILTAHHVGKPLTRFEKFGLALVNHTHRYIIRTDETVFVEIAVPGTEKEWGPDLAALILPAERKAEIEARKTFYNLDNHRNDLESIEAAIGEENCWAVAGVPEDWTVFESRVGAYRGMVGISTLTRALRHKGYAFVDFILSKNPPEEPPKTFGGVSGGGLWLAPFAKNQNGVYSWTGRSLLAGVAFYEFRGNGDPRSIRCHGPSDVYGLVYEIISRELSRNR